MVMLCFGVLACNTVQGVGRDIESIGKAGEDIIDGE
ncbi:MAG: entericidin [Sphingomonadales bacterium]